MSKPNRLERVILKTQSLPNFLQLPVLNFALRRTVKLVGTAKVEALELTKNKALFRIKNRKKVQNHIGSVHAAAMALLAETASGMVVGMSVSDDCIPVIKTLKVNFLKRAVGDMVAEATLTEEQVNSILSQEKGELEVKVVVTDQENKQPIECQMIWAWVPKRR